MVKVNTICLVDDDLDILDAVGETLRRKGFRLRKFHGAEGVLETLSDDWPGIVLSDMRMPRVSGIQLLENIRAAYPSIPVILFSAHGDVAAATQIMKLGAEDFIEKPIEPDLLLEIVSRAIDKRRLFLENRALTDRLENGYGLSQALPGQSDAMKRVRAQIRQIAANPLNTLILGESGTGKASAARAIHALTASQPDRLIEFNARIATGAQLKSELGDRLAWDDPDAPGATVLLRHVDRASEDLQDALLDHANCPGLRIIGTSDVPLDDLRASSALTPDFFFFLSAACLDMPPLRARREDILPILRQRLVTLQQRNGGDAVTIAEDLARKLKSHDWPGNLGELGNVAERLTVGLDLHIRSRTDVAQPLEFDDAMRHFEERLIEDALMATGGHKTEAARRLNIPRKRLYLRMKALGMLADDG